MRPMSTGGPPGKISLCVIKCKYVHTCIICISKHFSKSVEYHLAALHT